MSSSKKKSQYIKTGKCIWCGKEIPDTSFYHAPHVVPQKLGGKEICFDVCDECNSYFGKSTTCRTAMDIVFKEIFNAYMVFGKNLDQNSHIKLRSIFFNYFHSKQKITMKGNFRPSVITRQFKRSLYEVFLQKYHLVTGNGNHPMFEAVRKYARFNIGDLHVYYVFNNMVLLPKEEDILKLPMSANAINDMMNYGMFRFWFAGHLFYLEIFPTIYNVKGKSFLENEKKSVLVPVKGNECISEIKDVRQIDYFMMRFAS